MKLDNLEVKENLIKRLKRIEGQIRGVAEMLANERDCREIMQQLAAAHSALRATSRTFFREYAAICMTEMDQQASSEYKDSHRIKMVEEMLALLDKTP